MAFRFQVAFFKCPCAKVGAISNPSGFSTLRILTSAALGSGIICKALEMMTASNESFAKVNAVASSMENLTFDGAIFLFAVSIILGEKSVASICRTNLAMPSAIKPVPVATSKTRISAFSTSDIKLYISSYAALLNRLISKSYSAEYRFQIFLLSPIVSYSLTGNLIANV